MLSLTFYTEKFLGTFSGKSYGPVIIIKPSHKADKGIHEHEKYHAMQWWFFMFMGILSTVVLFSSPQLKFYSQFWYVPLLLGASVHGLLYYFNWRYRLYSEISAYKIQANCYIDDRRSKFSKFIYTKYSLSEYISESEIYKKMLR